MKQVLIIFGCLYFFSLPAGALGKNTSQPQAREQGTPNYIDSLNNNPPSLLEAFRQIAKNLAPSTRSGPAVIRWLQSQKYQIELLLMSMSILERLTLGIGLAFFGLATLYVLIFRSSITRSLPRLLFRLVLILILITTSSLSYFTLFQALIPQNDQTPSSSLGGSEHLSQVK